MPGAYSYSLKILLENLLRREDGRVVRPRIERLAHAWDALKGAGMT